MRNYHGRNWWMLKREKTWLKMRNENYDCLQRLKMWGMRERCEDWVENLIRRKGGGNIKSLVEVVLSAESGCYAILPLVLRNVARYCDLPQHAHPRGNVPMIATQCPVLPPIDVNKNNFLVHKYNYWDVYDIDNNNDNYDENYGNNHHDNYNDW